jgi:signal transduction histidine kinase
MTGRSDHPLTSLDGVRRSLSFWYAGTIAAVLALLGAGIFFTIRQQYSVQLTQSLNVGLRRLESASRLHALGYEGRADVAGGLNEVEEQHAPNRFYYLLRPDGSAVRPADVPDWIRSAARTAGSAGEASVDWEPEEDRDYRLRAERFDVSGETYVAVAVADRVELEDQYASLILLFGAAGLVAFVLLGAAGWMLVGKAIAPIERTITHMRRFMADAAHELRTPVAVIRTSAEVALQQERDAASYAARLVAIEAESNRLARIVDDLFTLARADAGDRPIDRRPLYLDDVVSDAVSAAHVLARAKGVSVDMPDYEETLIDGDAALVRQLLMIVLDNAVKFTPRGGRVTVRVHAGGAPCAIVEDTGVGIDAVHLPHVFERFYRGDAAHGRAGESGTATSGAGLGLAIARWIADAHAAHIEMRSTPGAGTTVAIVFPPVDRTQERPISRDRASSATTPPASPISSPVSSP